MDAVGSAAVQQINVFCPPRDESIEAEVKECEAIPERVNRLAERALRWIDLRKKGNGDKKIALLLYDYPPWGSEHRSGRIPG